MFKKSVITLIAILSCCVLTCVGFSAWSFVVTGDMSSSADGDISADDIIKSDDYIVISDVAPFEITEKGFKENNKSSVDGGKVTAQFTVYTDKCLQYSVTGEIQVEVTLGLHSSGAIAYNLFDGNNSSFLSSPTVAEKDADLTVSSPSGSFSNNSYVTTFTLTVTPGSTGEAHFQLVYTFNMGKSTNYSNYIYNVFYDANAEDHIKQDIKFAFGITIKNK